MTKRGKGMGDTEKNQVLKRKASLGKRQHEARAMPPTKALRLALSRSAERLMDLAVVVSGIRQERLDHEGLVSQLDNATLLLGLEGTGDRIGGCAIDGQMVAALIEQQTLGWVIGRAAEARPLTFTDAMMVAPLLDTVLDQFARALRVEGQAHWSDGYRFCDRVEDRRAMGLRLSGNDYHVFRLSIDFADGAKTGEFTLFLPEEAAPVAVPDTPDDPAPDHTGKYEAQLSGARASLTAVLMRRKMRLSEVTALKPGDLLTFEQNDLSKIELKAGGFVIPLPAKLGQLNGMRAVRLDMPGVMRKPHKDSAAGTPLPEIDLPEPAGAEQDETDLSAELPELPDLSALDELPDDLPDLPPLHLDEEDSDGWELPDLPDLPDLPELEQETGT